MYTKQERDSEISQKVTKKFLDKPLRIITWDFLQS